MNKFYIEDDNGVEIPLPTKRVICPRCDGQGVHDHPAFENGISSEEFAEDEDFREDYFRGRYDVPCSECHGRNVIEIPDEERMSADLITRWHAWQRDEADYRAAERAERMMGA